MNKDNTSFWIKPLIQKESASKLASKKIKDAFAEPDLIYLPYQIYTFSIEMKRLGLSPKTINIQIAANGITAGCSNVVSDRSQFVPGKPKESVIRPLFKPEELAGMAQKEAFFCMTKRYFLLFKPEMTCTDIEEVHYPFWYCGSDYYIDARKGNLEKMSMKCNRETYRINL